jgi:uncharacterized beta-barrel protein YwiB (DUF1934 family)
MSNFMLKISTKIHSEDYDDVINSDYPCQYSCESGIHRLKYTDDEAGFTVIKISPDGEINIRRQNSFPILLREGYSHTVDYDSPYGKIPMEFTARSILVALNEQGGRVEYITKLVIGGAPQTNTVIMELISQD